MDLITNMVQFARYELELGAAREVHTESWNCTGTWDNSGAIYLRCIDVGITLGPVDFLLIAVALISIAGLIALAWFVLRGPRKKAG